MELEFYNNAIDLLNNRSRLLITLNILEFIIKDANEFCSEGERSRITIYAPLGYASSTPSYPQYTMQLWTESRA